MLLYYILLPSKTTKVLWQDRRFLGLYSNRKLLLTEAGGAKQGIVNIRPYPFHTRLRTAAHVPPECLQPRRPYEAIPAGYKVPAHCESLHTAAQHK